MADKETLINMCEAGDTEGVRRALSRGENFKKVGGEAVTGAAERGHVDTVAVLLELGLLDVNATSERASNVYKALHMAASRGHSPVTALLLSKPGIDVNKATSLGSTAMHKAAWNNHNNVLTLLLNHPEIEVNQATSSGCTALHLTATWKNHTNVLTLLSNYPGINLAATTKQGKTVLHRLVANQPNCDPDFLRNLLTNMDVDPNAKNLHDCAI